MTDVERRVSEESRYRDHLSRSVRKWDRWSDYYGLSERDLEPMRVDLIDRLGLNHGDTVLEIGCGPGVNFEAIVDRIGESGHLVAIDFSPEMIDAATDRVDEFGWENVDINRADATTADLGTAYDATIATLSLSVMPDIDRAVANVHSAMASGGRLGVLDVRPVPSGPLRVLNPAVRRFLRWYANWNPDGDVIDSIEKTFAATDVFETYTGGTLYALRADKA